MKQAEQRTWHRRHWLALCISTLVAACGGGGEEGTAQWDTAASVWDDMTWN